MIFQVFNRYRTVIFCLFSLIFFINFATMPRIYYGADANFMRMASINLLNRGALDVVSPPEVTTGPRNRGAFLYQNGEKYYSKYGIMTTLLFAIPLAADKIYNKAVHGQPFFLPLDQLTEKYKLYSRSRIFFLNIFSLLLTLLTAFFLVKILSFYTRSPYVQGFYILACFYSTFLWNYLRAHSSEIFQLLFFLMFYYFFMRFSRTLSGKESGSVKDSFRSLLFAMISLLFLCLTKLVYVVLFPIIYLFTPLVLYRPGINIITCSIQQVRTHFREYLNFLILPTAGFFLVIACVNNHKFGSPLITGYSQWLEERELFFPERIFEGLYGFLFSIQKSIFLHFSVLLLSFFGARKFYREHTFDYLFPCSIFVVFLLLNACFLKWHGGHCYGPRYLLFILPVISIPAINLVSILDNRKKRFRKTLRITAGCILLLYTCKLQIQVNSLNFYSYYHVKDIFRFIRYDKKDAVLSERFSRIESYFKSRDFGTVSGDLISFKERERPFYPIKQLPEGNSDLLSYVKQLVIMASRYNYFWFETERPDLPRPSDKSAKHRGQER